MTAPRISDKHPGTRRVRWAVARAVAHLNVLIEYLLPLVKVGGVMLARKAKAGRLRHSQLRSHEIIGWEVETVDPVNLPGVADDRYLVIVDKVAATREVPRKAGIPMKMPL